MPISLHYIYIHFLALYILCLPLGTMNIGIFGSLLKLVAFLPTICCIFRAPHIRKNKLAGIYGGFCLLIIFSISWSIYVPNSLTRSFTQLTLFIIMISSCFFTISSKDRKLIKNAMVWSSRITVVLLFLLGVLYEGRLTFSGIMEEDPNYLCMYFSFGLVFAIETLLTSSKYIKKVVSVLEIVLYLYVVLLTGSRGGLLAILFCFGSYILVYQKKNNIAILKRGMVILVGLSALYALLSIISPILSDRFTINNVIESGGTGRVDIWKSGVDLYTKSSLFRQIFGYGTATVAHAFHAQGYLLEAVMHNIYLEQLVELGIVGFIYYTFMIFLFALHAYKSNDKYAFSIMIGFIVMSLSTSLYAFKPYINIMLYIILCENVCENSPSELKHS